MFSGDSEGLVIPTQSYGSHAPISFIGDKGKIGHYCSWKVFRDLERVGPILNKKITCDSCRLSNSSFEIKRRINRQVYRTF